MKQCERCQENLNDSDAKFCSKDCEQEAEEMKATLSDNFKQNADFDHSLNY